MKKCFYLCTPPILTTIDSIYDSLEEAIEFIANNLEERLNRTEGSGWCMTSLDRVELHITRRELVNINNFKAYPKGVRGSDQVINIQSGYNCVITALEAYVVLRDNPPTRINNLPRVLMRRMGRGQFNIKHSPADMPLTHDSFKTLEKGNNLNIYLYKLCELGMGGKQRKKHWTVHLARKGGNPQSRHLVTLLLITDDHVALIKDMLAFVKKFRHGFKQGRGTEHAGGMCYNCLTLFNSPTIREAHTQACTARTTVEYPEPGQFKQFTKVKALQPISHMAFLDFEAYNIQPKTGEDDPRIVSRQKAFAYCYVIVDGRTGEYCTHRLSHGEKCVDDCLQNMNRDWALLRERMRAYPLHMTPESTRKFEASTHCEGCNVEFKAGVTKMRHHAHSVARDNFLCALCQQCNLKIQFKEPTLTVFVHNLSYDIALVLKEAGAQHDFEILKREGSKFYSARSGNLRFVDSNNVIRGTLSSLASSHIKQKGSLEIVRKLLTQYSRDCLDLVLGTGKQYYPYDYVTGFNILRKPGIPSRECFDSELTGETLSSEDYAHVVKVWNAANCANLLDYTILYLLMDVGLLADVYLAWRKAAMAQFGLDPARYLTSTSLSLDAFLYSSKIRLPSFRMVNSIN
ncbi:uncharacterized protein [Macrobrachium rosenbergii]|uniref:uncharacterized protein n=1 Tax=Macrobrachium rosenbergii TaxID=79674 RepID=UPI0034D41F5A